MSRIEITPKMESEKALIPYLAKFLFLSFEHSQGNPDVQRTFMLWLRLKLGLIDLTEQQITDLRERAFPAIKSWATGPKHGDPGPTLANDFELMFIGLTATLKQDGTDDAILNEFYSGLVQPGLAEVIESLIITEEMYLVENGGKGRPHDNDKYNSYLARYLVRGDSTGEPLFDEIYSAMRNAIRDMQHSKHAKSNLIDLQKILTVYNRHHPNTPASLEDLFKE